MLGLAALQRLRDQFERQAKVDLTHPDRDGEDHVRRGVKDHVCGRREAWAVVLGARNALAERYQEGADIRMGEGILAPDVIR